MTKATRMSFVYPTRSTSQREESDSSRHNIGPKRPRTSSPSRGEPDASRIMIALSLNGDSADFIARANWTKKEAT